MLARNRLWDTGLAGKPARGDPKGRPRPRPARQASHDYLAKSKGDLRRARVLVSLQAQIYPPCKEYCMPRLSRRIRLAALVLAWLCPVWSTPVAAEENGGRQWSAELGVGVEYDSNVSVDEVDVTSSQGDYALTLDAGFALKQPLSGSANAALTYDFSSSNYREFSEVDRQTHMFGLDLNVSYAGMNPGITLYYIDSRLDGSQFLQLSRYSPYVSGFLSKRWFARGAYVYSDKTIQNQEARDATTHAGEGDLYFFVRGLRTYFNFGYRYRNENARADQYDYLSNAVKLRFIQRFELFSRLTKLELAWRYEDRKYQSDTPSIGEKRHDQRNRLRVDYQIPVFARGAIQFFAGYADYDSNYPPAAYDQTLVGTRFFYTW